MTTVLSSFYERMVLIRCFEERVLELFDQGVLVGTTHTTIGQEAVAVGVLTHARAGDMVFSGHRCHGHYLAFTDDVDGLMAELMGRETGPSRGIGGSQHIAREGFYSNGVLGGIVPAAVGGAYAAKVRGEDTVAFMFLGDGAFGEGVVYEALNMAALWSIPVLFVVENNLYAQTTPISLNTSGTLRDRFAAFDIAVEEEDGNDVLAVAGRAEAAAAAIRAGKGPRALVLATYRLSPHSKGDDFRPPEELDGWRARDPLFRVAGALDADAVQQANDNARARIEGAVVRALAAKPPRELVES